MRSEDDKESETEEFLHNSNFEIGNKSRCYDIEFQASGGRFAGKE